MAGTHGLRRQISPPIVEGGGKKTGDESSVGSSYDNREVGG